MKRSGNMRAVGVAFWRLFMGLMFYPLVIGLFIWLYIKGAHWIYGLALIAVVLWFDRMWWILLRRILTWRPHKSGSRNKH